MYWVSSWMECSSDDAHCTHWVTTSNKKQSARPTAACQLAEAAIACPGQTMQELDFATCLAHDGARPTQTVHSFSTWKPSHTKPATGPRYNGPQRTLSHRCCTVDPMHTKCHCRQTLQDSADSTDTQYRQCRHTAQTDRGDNADT